MGVISRMRDISPYLLVLFVISFIAFMVISDSSISTVFNSGTTAANAVVGVINGENIPYQEFELRVKEQAELQTQQNPQAEVDENQIRQSVWDQYVEEILIKQSANKAGIKVTQDEVLDLMLDSPPDYLTKNFTDSTGKFNRQAYLEVMTNPDIIAQNINEGKKRGVIPQTVDPAEEVGKFKKSLIKIEDFLYKSRLADHFRRAVGAASSIVSPTFLEQKFKNENTNMSFDYILLDILKVSDKEVGGKPSDQELKAEYEKVKEFTKQKEARKIKYVSFPLEPSKADTLIAQKKIARIQQSINEAITPEIREAVYQQYLAEYSGKQNEYVMIKTMAPDVKSLLETSKPGDIVGPVQVMSGTYIYHVDSTRAGENEVVKASHILINFGTNKDSSKALAQQILGRAKKGEDFALLAKTYSQDQGSKDRGGEYDFFPKGRMVKPFEDACFNNAPGSIVGPIETDFGYHIIKVQDKASEEMKYSEILINISMSQNTKKQLKRDALSFKQQVENGTDIDQLGKSLKKNIVETMFFDKDMPILGSRFLTNFTFSEKVGTVSDPLELKYYGFVVALVTGERQNGLKQFEDMKDELTEKVMRSKKLAFVKSKAQNIVKQLQQRNADRLFKVAEFDPAIEVKSVTDVKNTASVPGLGLEPVLTQSVMNAPINKINAPVAGEKGWFITQVLQKTDADMKAFKMQSAEMKKSMSASAKNSAYPQWFQALKDNADIEDNRGKLFRD